MAHSFDNGPLITDAGEIDWTYLKKSARERAIFASDTGTAELREVHIWEEKLHGMALMMQTRWHRDDTMRRFAVSALVGHCESIAASGALPEPAEQSLRMLIAQTLSAFQMPAKADRVMEEA
jgi:hypothetical protein